MMLRPLTLSLCLVLGLTACEQEQKTNDTAEVIRPIRAIQVGAHEEFSVRKFPGRAAASNAVTLAFEVSGKLNKIPVAVGDHVKRGDVLASIDSRDFKNALDQANAELKRTKAQYERMKNALADNAVAKQDVTNAEAAYDSARAAVEIRRKALEDTQLLAPYDAIISEKRIKSFGNVQAKQPAIRLVDPTRIEMSADIPEDLISYAEEGMEIMVTFDAFPDLTVSSRISEIGAEASQSTRTYPVTLIMDQPEGFTILPGMSGKGWRKPDANFDNAPDGIHGFNIPLTAVQSATDGNQYVWVIDPDTGVVNRLQEGQKVRIIK